MRSHLDLRVLTIPITCFPPHITFLINFIHHSLMHSFTFTEELKSTNIYYITMCQALKIQHWLWHNFLFLRQGVPSLVEWIAEQTVIPLHDPILRALERVNRYWGSEVTGEKNTFSTKWLGECLSEEMPFFLLRVMNGSALSSRKWVERQGRQKKEQMCKMEECVK